MINVPHSQEPVSDLKLARDLGGRSRRDGLDKDASFSSNDWEAQTSWRWLLQIQHYDLLLHKRQTQDVKFNL